MVEVRGMRAHTTDLDLAGLRKVANVSIADMATLFEISLTSSFRFLSFNFRTKVGKSFSEILISNC